MLADKNYDEFLYRTIKSEHSFRFVKFHQPICLAYMTKRKHRHVTNAESCLTLNWPFWNSIRRVSWFSTRFLIPLGKEAIRRLKIRAKEASVETDCKIFKRLHMKPRGRKLLRKRNKSLFSLDIGKITEDFFYAKFFAIGLLANPYRWFKRTSGKVSCTQDPRFFGSNEPFMALKG